MRLRLTIVNSDINSGVRKEVVFERQGGMIGRKESNDWVLPDAKRFISSKHAIIQFENNGFLLGDLSTNGVYVNDATSPIGNGNFVSLRSGDQIKIGDYNILVNIEEEQVAMPDASSTPEILDEVKNYQSSNISVFPEDIDPLELLGSKSDKPVSADSVNPRQSSLDDAPVSQDYFQPPQFKSTEDEVYAIPTNWAELPDFEQSPAPNDEKINPRSTKSPDVVDRGDAQFSDKAINSFLRGVGIQPAALEQVDISDVMFDFGRVLRTTVQSLMEILSARAQLKSEFRMNYTTIRVKENNPLKFSMSVDDALNNLFLNKGEDHLSPIDAVDEAVKNLKDHQIALLAGMQAALRDLVQQFDPESVEKNIEKYMEVSSKIPVYRKAKSWDLYCQNYIEFEKGMGDNFQDMFGNAFTEAYEKQISELSSRRIKR